jgi:CHAD domain-containing protein
MFAGTMKILITYLKKRKKNIQLLLKKPALQYTPETFHELRIEIKKWNALLELIHFCSINFKKKKVYKHFKPIFCQAGKIRELQIEEIILKKYFPVIEVKEYSVHLNAIRIKEEALFFLITKTKFLDKIKKQFTETIPFLEKIKKKKIDIYIKKRKRKINAFLKHKNNETIPFHKMRKLLKQFLYTLNLVDIKQQNLLLLKEDLLPDLLGRWHDNQVIIKHLKKAINRVVMNPNEKTQLEVLKNTFYQENEQLLKRINAFIPLSKFYPCPKKS